MMNLKKFKVLVLFVLFSISTIYAQELITNESVLQMHQLGFDDLVIIDKINTSDVKFDTSIAALGKLSKAGVSSDIISLIMQKSKQNTKSKTGIYFTLENGEQKLIQPTVFIGTSKNAVAQKLVSGLINSKTKSRLPKTQSSNVIRNSQPEFTFIFNPMTTEVDNLQNNQGEGLPGLVNWWFRVASNPNEFVLVKLKVKERQNQREVITGTSNFLSNSSGIDSKKAINFSIEEIEGNKFRVIPDTLTPGEYAFLYQGQVPQGRSNQSVFDFSIQ
jgi:hypothetical protein